MQLNELFAPEPDETAGKIIFRAPITATLTNSGSGQQQQVQLPKGTVVLLVKKLPQKQLVIFSVDGKQYVTTEQDWKKAVNL